MMGNSKLICFIGIDGSGKTTLAKRLVELMKRKGMNCKYIHGGYKPLILKPIMIVGRLFFLRQKNGAKNYVEARNRKRKIFNNYFLSKTYKLILLLDYLVQIFLKLNLSLIFGKKVICDRYVYDVIINDLSVDLHLSKRDIKNLLRICFYILPKPEIVFVLDVPEDIAIKRKNDISSTEFLRDRRSTYLWLGKEYRMVILDGTKSIKELKNLVLKVVSSAEETL